MLAWSTLWSATLLQQTRYTDVDRRCCIAHSLRSALVPCLSLTGLTSSIHLGIPNLGGRGQMRRTSSSSALCWVASREGQQGVHSELQGNCRPAVDRAFLADTFDALHIQMYRNAVDVLESFGSTTPGDKPPPRTEDLRASHDPVLQERLSPADTSLIPQDNFCKDMSLHCAETFQLCSGPTQRTGLSRRTRVVPSSERRYTRGGRCFGPALCGLMRCLRLSGPLACPQGCGSLGCPLDWPRVRFVSVGEEL